VRYRSEARTFGIRAGGLRRRFTSVHGQNEPAARTAGAPWFPAYRVRSGSWIWPGTSPTWSISCRTPRLAAAGRRGSGGIQSGSRQGVGDIENTASGPTGFPSENCAQPNHRFSSSFESGCRRRFGGFALFKRFTVQRYLPQVWRRPSASRLCPLSVVWAALSCTSAPIIAALQNIWLREKEYPSPKMKCAKCKSGRLVIWQRTGFERFMMV
jgi:hypothetical protein